MRWAKMSSSLEVLLAQKIAAGLNRKAITTCSKWAEAYRMMQIKGGATPWTFDDFPWTREMHDCNDELAVGQKAAQMGYTEMCLNRCFYSIDIEAKSVLYVLPTEGNANNFSSSRFDPALELSPHLQTMFSDVKNKGHKRAGACNLFVRGSKSKSGMKSDPCGQMFFDEVDEMDQNNITLAFERMSGQAERQAWMISTPTIDGKGINAFYDDSTKEHFFFNCPCCNKLTELVFPDCLVITSDNPNDQALKDTHIICKECQGVIPHEDKQKIFKTGQWVPEHSNRLTRGFHVNQLYSCRLEPWHIAQLWLKAQTNPTDEQEFYNSKMGVTHAVEGAQLCEKDIEDCIGGYKKQQSASGTFVTMGVDVGTWLHFEIDEYTFDEGVMTNDINLLTKCRVLNEGKVKTFEELDLLMLQYGVSSCVIDHQPETRKALEFANRFDGIVNLCIYGLGIASRNIRPHGEGEHKVTVDRTSWLDISLNRFRSQSIKLPVDVSEEFKRHMTAPVRVYKRDKSGNPYGVYENTKDDHAAHSRNYAEIALQIGAGSYASQDIESPV